MGEIGYGHEPFVYFRLDAKRSGCHRSSWGENHSDSIDGSGVMKLSQHFTLDEFLISQMAARLDIDMHPTQEVIDNLEMLCQAVLEPLRGRVGRPIVISSGYRPRALNEAIGGSPNSAHMFGLAADCRALGVTIHDFAFAASSLTEQAPIDQVIKEFNRWVHIGVSDDPRGQILTASRRDGQTVYEIGLV